MAVIPSSDSAAGDRYTIYKKMMKANGCKGLNVFPTRTKSKQIKQAVYMKYVYILLHLYFIFTIKYKRYRQNADIIMEQMQNTECRTIQKRKQLRDHTPWCQQKLSYNDFENASFKTFDPECVLSITSIPIGENHGFHSESAFITKVQDILAHHRIETTHIHPNFRSLTDALQNKIIAKPDDASARIGFRNAEDCEQSIKALRSFHSQFGWRVYSVSNPWQVTKTSFSDFKEQILLLISEADLFVLKMAIWVDKGQGKTVAKMRIIDEDAYLYPARKSSIVTLSEYVGGESKIDEMIGPELCRLLNQLIAVSFNHSSGLKFGAKPRFCILDHSAGCGMYGIKSVK
eukprot:875413_1